MSGVASTCKRCLLLNVRSEGAYSSTLVCRIHDSCGSGRSDAFASCPTTSMCLLRYPQADAQAGVRSESSSTDTSRVRYSTLWRAARTPDVRVTQHQCIRAPGGVAQPARREKGTAAPSTRVMGAPVRQPATRWSPQDVEALCQDDSRAVCCRTQAVEDGV